MSVQGLFLTQAVTAGRYGPLRRHSRLWQYIWDLWFVLLPLLLVSQQDGSTRRTQPVLVRDDEMEAQMQQWSVHPMHGNRQQQRRRQQQLAI
jgi:hypothetical protein